MSNKIISYALFGSRTTEPWLFAFYLRGFVWNVRMNRLIYPEWQTHVEIDAGTFSDYDNLFIELQRHYGISYNVNMQEELCKSMLWRLKPVFNPDTELVLCRDADAITTLREQVCVNEWINSGKQLHGINDNPAHQLPLMGGMVGIRSDYIRSKFASWDGFMHDGGSFEQHGSDQQHIMRLLYIPGTDIALVSDMRGRISDHTNPLWTSDLTCRHIGSAGVVEMETIRFFKQHDPNSPFIEIEKKYPHIFFWHL